MVVIQDSSGEKNQIISGDGRYTANTDIDSLKDSASKLRRKVKSLQRKTYRGGKRWYHTIPIPWNRAVLSVLLHGLMLIGLTSFIQWASVRRHLPELVPWLVMGSVFWMFGCSLCTWVYLGAELNYIPVIGFAFSLEWIVLYAVGSITHKSPGNLSLVWYAAIIGVTVAAALCLWFVRSMQKAKKI
mmetsp:Transcript_1159/g.2341  ORF Transcript_1159/g.2341 Transcript_1159/m.2341 type:complete len:186 (-) Transcript_1159:104-661(-)